MIKLTIVCQSTDKELESIFTETTQEYKEAREYVDRLDDMRFYTIESGFSSDNCSLKKFW
jgi:hypothetical protein